MDRSAPCPIKLTVQAWSGEKRIRVKKLISAILPRNALSCSSSIFFEMFAILETQSRSFSSGGFVSWLVPLIPSDLCKKFLLT